MNLRKKFIKKEIQENIDLIEQKFLNPDGEFFHMLKNSPEILSFKSCVDSLQTYYMQLEIAKLREELDLLKQR